MRYAKGIMWLDDCRIPFVDDGDIPKATTQRDSEEMNHKTKELLGYEKWGVGMELDVKRITYEQNQQGRFTPNLLVCDDMLNDGNIIQYNKTRKDNGTYLGGHREEFVGTDNNPIVNKVKGQFFNDKGTNSRYYDLDKWFDKMIDNL